MLESLGLPLWQLALCAGVAALAGYVRGFSGFGLSAVLVAGTTLWLAPRDIVPVAVVLELGSSLVIVRQVKGDIHWDWLRPLIIGYLVCLPLGVWVLATTQDDTMRLAGYVVIAFAALAQLAAELTGRRLHWGDSPLVRYFTGVCGGFFSGLSSLGGMVVSTMLLGANTPAAKLRATMIALMLFSAAYQVLCGSQFNLYNAKTFLLSLLLGAPCLIGIWLGGRGFARVSERGFRRFVLALLLLVAGGNLARVLFLR